VKERKNVVSFSLRERICPDFVLPSNNRRRAQGGGNEMSLRERKKVP